MEKIQISDAELAVWTQGGGKTILFIHGFPFDHQMYLASVSPLADEFRVIIPDLRGFGESRFSVSEAESMKTDFLSMADYADDLLGILDAFAIDKAILCGLSMGGYIAMNFMRRYPERLAGLIFCDTKPIPDPPQAAENRLLLAQNVWKTGAEPLPDKMIPNLLSEKTRHQSPETVNFLRSMILRQPVSGIAAASRGMARRDDSTPYLAQISVPTLVLGGENDPLSTPEAMKAMAGQIPNSEFAVLPNAAHLPPMETPALFTEKVRAFARSVR